MAFVGSLFRLVVQQTHESIPAGTSRRRRRRRVVKLVDILPLVLAFMLLTD